MPIIDCNDYIDDNVTLEWINDVKYMSPSPHPNHGVVYSQIFNSIYNYLKGKNCRVFPNKTDLLLSKPNDLINIADLKKPVVPDLFIICNKNFELVSNTIVAIPDFICEIVSPSSMKIDNNLKKNLYLSRQVKEYWIVNYLDRTIKVHFNNEETVFNFEDEVKINILDDFSICLKDVELFEV